eukprot:Gb_07387 [translate_table: standard]
MEGPFFTSLWDPPHFQTGFPQTRSHHHHHATYPEASPLSPAMPLTGPRQNVARKEPSQPKSSPVTIPVHFINTSNPPESPAKRRPSEPSAKKVSHRMNDTAAAVKIQSAFRGFSVRKSAPLKNLKLIAQVKANMEEIRQRIEDPQVVQMIRQNEKERLKITEGLMSLLLKLDAIQGVNSVVRESRKAVIRELVKLQERVDSILTAKPAEEEDLQPAPDVAAAYDAELALGNPLDRKISVYEEQNECKAVPIEENVLNVRGNEYDGEKDSSEPRQHMSEDESLVAEGAEGRASPRPDSKFETKAEIYCANEDAGEAKGDTIEIQELSSDVNQEDRHSANEDVGDVMKDILENQELTSELNHKDINYPHAERADLLYPITQVQGLTLAEEHLKDSIKPIEDLTETNNEDQNRHTIHSEEELKEAIEPDQNRKFHSIVCAADHGSNQEKMVKLKGQIQETDSEVGTSKDDQRNDSVGLERVERTAAGRSKFETAETIGFERVREENKELKKLIADLCQKSEMQNEIISNLGKRIEQLEKRLSESSRNRKKKEKQKGSNQTDV